MTTPVCNPNKYLYNRGQFGRCKAVILHVWWNETLATEKKIHRLYQRRTNRSSIWLPKCYLPCQTSESNYSETSSSDSCQLRSMESQFLVILTTLEPLCYKSVRSTIALDQHVFHVLITGKGSLVTKPRVSQPWLGIDRSSARASTHCYVECLWNVTSG